MSTILNMWKRYQVAIISASLIATFLASQFVGGEGWDDSTHERGFREAIAFGLGVLRGEPNLDFRSITSNLEFYGILPNVIASTALYIARFFGAPADFSWDVYRFALHANAMAWGVATAYVTFKITKIMSGDRELAWFAAVLLMTYPLWLGHSFFAFKDLPLAFFFSLALYAALLSFTVEDAVYRRAAAIFAIAAIGTCAVKLAGAPLLLTMSAALFSNAITSSSRNKRIVVLAMSAVTILIGVYVLTPPAWVDPIAYGIENLSHMSQHVWSGCTLTAGECLAPHSANWSAFEYVARWSLVQFPLIVWLLLIPTVAFVVLKGDMRERWVLLSIVIPLALIIAINSVLYTGLRHLLFVIPPVFALVVVASARLVRTVLPEAKRDSGLGALKAAFVASIAVFLVDNVSLFPYGYSYFNEIARPFVDHRAFITDYSGFSLREAAHIANTEANRSGDTRLTYVAVPRHLVTPFLLPGMRFKNPQTLAPGTPYLRIFLSRMEDSIALRCAHMSRRGLPILSPGACSSSVGCLTIGAVRRTLVFGKPLVMSYVQRCVTP